MTRIRVSGTVDSQVAEQVDLEHEARVMLAKMQGEREPYFSQTVEDLLKGGLATRRTPPVNTQQTF